MATDQDVKSKRSANPTVMRVARVAPYAIGGILLVIYFVWMFSEMSVGAGSGGGLPLGIFGGVLLGTLAGGASMLFSRRNRE